MMGKGSVSLFDFLRSFPFDLPPELEQLRKRAVAEGVPIIRDDAQRFMAFLMQLRKPGRILEIGTAVGFSALLMAHFDPQLKQLVTIEDYEPRIQKAKENLAKSDAPIELVCGDAAEVIKTLSGEFDFVFVDAAKGQYPVYLRLVKPLLSDGALIVADNILQGGRILLPKEALDRRDRSMHRRIREYISEVMTDPSLTSTVLEVGDGLAVSSYNRQEW